MRHARRLSLGAIGVAAFTLILLLSGCGRTTTSLAGKAAPTRTLTPRPTMAPATPTTATTSAGTISGDPGCPPAPAPVQPQYVAVGALSVSVPARPYGHDYPSALLPSGLPNAPYQVSLTPAEAEGAFHPNPPVNPSLAMGYSVQICNETSAAHTLTSLSVSIASFIPRSGPVAVWHICEHGPYDTATQHTTPGCGGGFGASDLLAATLPGDFTGASAPARATNMGVNVDLPAIIDPHESITLLVAVNGLTSQGTYALSFGVSVDGSAQTMLTPSDGSFLIASSAVTWTGDTCQTPAMQAQIPPSSQHTYYVCPPAP